MSSPQSVSKAEQKAAKSYTLNSYLYSAPSATESLCLDRDTHSSKSSMSSDLQDYVDGLGNVIEKDVDKKKRVLVKL